jgi:hypothetical protein
MSDDALKPSPKKVLEAAETVNEVVGPLTFGGIIGSLFKSPWEIYLLETIKNFTLSLALVTNVIDFGTSTSRWYEKFNKNSSGLLKYLVNAGAALLAIIAIIGLLAGIIFIAAIASILFLAAMALKFVYNTGGLIWNACKLAKLHSLKDTMPIELHDEMEKEIKQKMVEHGLGAVVSLLAGAAIGLLMVFKIAFPPIAIVGAAAVIGLGGFGLYSKIKKSSEEKDQQRAENDENEDNEKTELLANEEKQPHVMPAPAPTPTPAALAQQPAATDNLPHQRPPFSFEELKKRGGILFFDEHRRREIELEPLKSFEEKKAYLIKEIENKIEAITADMNLGASPSPWQRFSIWYQQDKRNNKLELLRNLRSLLHEKREDELYIRSLQKTLADATENKHINNPFQSFVRNRDGETGDIVQAVKVFFEQYSSKEPFRTQPKDMLRIGNSCFF